MLERTRSAPMPLDEEATTSRSAMWLVRALIVGFLRSKSESAAWDGFHNLPAPTTFTASGSAIEPRSLAAMQTVA
jgi:hypothetical protein